MAVLKHCFELHFTNPHVCACIDLLFCEIAILDNVALGSPHGLCLFAQYIVPETTTNWPLIAGLAGAGAVVAVVIIIITICVLKKRRKKQQLDFAAREEELEMKDRGKAVAGELIS